jgi:paraquat-inducible protein B
MSKQANKTLIGIFVVAAVALGVAAVLILGSGALFSKKNQWVAFFEGSVQGLRVGAPVSFRGVPIGQVTAIRVVYNRRDLSFWIPVLFEIDQGSIMALGAFSQEMTENQKAESFVEAGLKAELDMQSLVTGQLFINLDFFPDKPTRLIKAEIPEIDLPYPEIPTIRTPLQEISETLQEIQPQELLRNIKATLEGIDRLVNSPQIQEGTAELGETVKDIRAMVREARDRINSLSKSADGALSDARGLISRMDQTAQKTSRLMDDLSDKMAPIAETFTAVLETAQASLDQAHQTLRTIQVAVAQTDPLQYQLGEALTDMSAAARSIRVLADYIERNPAAFLRGKQGNGGR